MACLLDCLIDWLIDWLADWLIAWWIHWFISWLVQKENVGKYPGSLFPYAVYNPCMVGRYMVVQILGTLPRVPNFSLWLLGRSCCFVALCWELLSKNSLDTANEPKDGGKTPHHNNQRGCISGSLYKTIISINTVYECCIDDLARHFYLNPILKWALLLTSFLRCMEELGPPRGGFIFWLLVPPFLSSKMKRCAPQADLSNEK